MRRYVGRRERITLERWISHYGWSRKEALDLVETGQTEARVFVQDVGPSGEISERELEHHVLHSPAGWEWSYSGSGPAETARCLLIDYLGGLDALPCNAFGETVVPLYQQFKRDFIATAPPEGFTIADVEIAAWLVLAEASETVHAEAAGD